MMRPTYGGMPVLVSPALPLRPSPGEWARRFVRHGMADVLEWLGEEVGPEPDALTHVMVGMDLAHDGSVIAFVSAEMFERLKAQAPSPVQIVHGIDRYTQEHLCGEIAGLGTDAINPAMEITCPLCRLVLERRTQR